MIPITRLSVGSEEAAAASEAICSGWLAQGKRTEKFEALVAEYVGAKHGIACNSATTGLHLALLAAGVGPGDEVICPSYSFIATANAVLYAGATPVFVDIERRTYNIDPSLIASAITPRTKAILAVSQIGLAADIPAIMRIARRHGLKVVEDAAPSLGATAAGVRIGAISDHTVFSFDPRKILTTGEGGVITTNDAAAADRMRAMRAHSASVSMIARHRSSNVVLEQYPELGFNYKLTDVQAAIGIVQMTKLDKFIEERQRLARRYEELLSGEDQIELPYAPSDYRHVYQSYCVRLVGEHTQVGVMQSMANRQVATRRIIAIHQQAPFARMYPGLNLPETEQATSRTLLLPMFVGLTREEQDQVVDALVEALREPKLDDAPELVQRG